MSAAVWADIIGDTLALAIALLGWTLHVRQCRGSIEALRQENAKLIDTLAHLAERRENHVADRESREGWRPAP